MTVTIVSVQLVNKVAVNVNFAITCTTANDEAGDVQFPDTAPDSYNVVPAFTLTQNIKGNIVSIAGPQDPQFYFPSITCDGTSQPFTIQLLPQNGATSWYKPGPAFISNGTFGGPAVFDSDASCGQGSFFENPCDYVSNLAGGVQINGGTN
jgi:hypothetical protein